MTTKKLGLVFSGGGGKGAYEIGAWKALAEFGITENVAAVAGTSVGGLNAALFVQGDLEAAEQLWRDITPDQIMVFNKTSFARNAALAASAFFTPSMIARSVLAATKLFDSQGFFNQTGLANLIQRSGACDTVKQATLPLHVCALNTHSRQLEYPQLNGLEPQHVAKWLLASAAIPVVFDGVKIGDHTYVDGGVLPGSFSDNTPYKVLIEEHGCTHIINIFLERQPGLIAIQQAHPEVQFWNIIPRREFEGVISALNFTPENAAKLIDEGYDDVKNILEQFQAFRASEERYIAAIFDYAESQDYFVNQIQLNRQLRQGKISSGDTSEYSVAIHAASVDARLENHQSSQSVPQLVPELLPQPAPAVSSLSLEQVLAEIGAEIEQQEQQWIDQQLDVLLEEMNQNSLELLDEAFSAITTLAANGSLIEAQQQQSRFGRVLGNLTGKNQRHQVEVNHGLNRAIYAQQQLIQKLNHKSMLTMEAVATLANKTNYLMNHVNVLYGTHQLSEQRLNRALGLMKQGLETVERSLNQRIDQLDQRLERLERANQVNDWFHTALIRAKHENPYQALIETTVSFYLTCERNWDAAELARFNNALSLSGLADIELVPASLIGEAKRCQLLEQLDGHYIVPMQPQKQRLFPLLRGIQMLSEQVADHDPIAELEQDLNLNLFVPRGAGSLGMELLHSLRQNDRSPRLNGQSAHSLQTSQHTLATKMQGQWLDIVAQLTHVNQQQLQHPTLTTELAELQTAIEQFKVTVPIIGKFSAGKSSLLNAYLGIDHLTADITPETAIATELVYAERESVQIHFFDQRDVQEVTLAQLKTMPLSDEMAFLRVGLNNPKLKHRRHTALVDMPGFDSRNMDHHKAIATYLARGDYFVTLMPIEIPFDESVFKHLDEIYFDHGKEFGCLLSKAANRSAALAEQNKNGVSSQLELRYCDQIDVGLVEIRDKSQFTISAFEQMIDNATLSFDALLKARFGKVMLDLIESVSSQLNNKRFYAGNSAEEIAEQMATSEQAFAELKMRFESDLKEFRYNLVSQGADTVRPEIEHALTNHIPSLVNAAKSHSLENAIGEILRPVIHRELEALLERELTRFEQQIEQSTRFDISGLNIDFELPKMGKESFSFKAASFCAGISIFVLGPVGALITGLISGVLGRGDNQQQYDDSIYDQVQQQVIPQALAQVMMQISKQLSEAADHIDQQIHQQLAVEQRKHQEVLSELNQMHRERSAEFDSLQQTLEQEIQMVDALKQHI